MKFNFLIYSFAATMLFAGCSETDEVKPITVTGVSLNETTLAMVVGGGIFN